MCWMLSLRCTCEYCVVDLIDKALMARSILSPDSHAQNHAFASALLFAQDYGILAASAQDRPFVPVSTVVLEGAPRDLKAVFRRWRNPESAEKPNVTASKGLKRGGSLRVVGLSAALAAVRR